MWVTTSLEGTGLRQVILKQESLSYIFSRIKLLTGVARQPYRKVRTKASWNPMA